MRIRWNGVLTYLQVRCYNKPTKQRKEAPCPYAAIGEDTLPGGMKF